jgi:hypothetical protein
LIPALQQSVANIGRQPGIRIMVLTNQYRILADSEGMLEGQRFDQVRPPKSQRRDGLALGKYELPDGQEVLWVGAPMTPLNSQEQETAQRPRFFLVLAQSPRDSPALSNLLRLQFLVAGSVGLVLALLLAFLVARSIARPLVGSGDGA